MLLLLQFFKPEDKLLKTDHPHQKVSRSLNVVGSDAPKEVDVLVRVESRHVVLRRHVRFEDLQDDRSIS